MTDKSKHVVTSIILASVGAGLAYFITKYRTNLLGLLKTTSKHKTHSLKHQHVVLVNTVEECQHAIDNLRMNAVDFRAVGFDCEWVTINGSRQPIALLQLASKNGLCALIRLCTLRHIPKDLKELLEDTSVLKIGVAPLDDAKLLLQDYGVRVAGCLDLRHLARTGGGLGSMAQSMLGVKLDKNWRVRCGDWEAENLSAGQIDYAAKDALVAVEMFAQLVQQDSWGSVLGLWRRSEDWEDKLNLCRPHIDLRYKHKSMNAAKAAKRNGLLQEANHPAKDSTRAYSTRQKPLYNNFYLEAPDGEILSMCDQKKATWYVTNGLGEVVKEDPLTVRINFKPAGRPVGEVGRYYTAEKSNRCVVCGQTNSYLRKNIVPHDYRKHFPTVMKDHSSHDILLLCLECHKRSNGLDLVLRTQLAVQCNAPIASSQDVKVLEVSELRQVRSAARALRSAGANRIPPERREELQEVLRKFYQCQVTEELLERAENVQISVANPDYEPHGLQVVRYFSCEAGGGLVVLEAMWRQHFLNSMAPRFMPAFWSVHHNHERLTIRAEENRVGQDDLSLAGIHVMVKGGAEQDNLSLAGIHVAVKGGAEQDDLSPAGIHMVVKGGAEQDDLSLAGIHVAGQDDRAGFPSPE